MWAPSQVSIPGNEQTDQTANDACINTGAQHLTKVTFKDSKN